MKLSIPKLSLIPKPVRIWAGRVAALELAAIIHGLQQGKLPHTFADIAALLTGAVVAATPVLQASGLLRSVGPDDPSLGKQAWSAVVANAKAPAEKRKALAAAALAQAEVDTVAALAQAKADAQEAGRVAAQAEFTKLKKELTSKFQVTAAGLVPIEDTSSSPDNTSSSPDKALSDTSDLPGSGIPNVAGTGEEVVVPQDDAPALVAQETIPA